MSQNATCNPKAALWFLGGWFFLSVSMAYVAGSTFGTLKPEKLRLADEVFSPLEAEKERPAALRYVASELNRKFFLHYGNLQLVLGTIALVLVGMSRKRWAILAVLAALALAVWFRFDLIPQATELGRQIDFIPKEPITPERETFNSLHKSSTTCEMIKMVLLLVATFLYSRQPKNAA